MIKAILNGLLGFIKVIIASIMTPINALFVNLFPNLGSYLVNFNNVLNNYVSNFSGWFLFILPPNARALVVLYVQFLVSYYYVYISVLVVYNVFKLIRNLKIW